jgi:putative hydrolase of the HAD superfamily
MRAVIFDLWDTLVEWPVEEAEVLRQRIASLTGHRPAEFDLRWAESYRASQTGPLADAYRDLGVPDEHLDGEVAARHEFARRLLRPRRGAKAVLAELRRRGLRLGLMSVCSEEVPIAWPEAGIADLFDAATFSSDCAFMKPDPEIYLHTCRALEADPADCFFVGDGANDELGGAARVGMTPVLFVPAGAEPLWRGLESWNGLRVSQLSEVVGLCAAAA